MSVSRKYPLYKYLLAGLDWATLVASFYLAFVLRGRWNVHHPFTLSADHLAEMAFIMLFSGASIFVFQYFNLYKINVFVTLVDHALRVFKALLVMVLGMAILSFFVRASWIVDSRLALFYFLLSAVALLVAVRIVCFRKIFMWLSRQRVIGRKALVIGAGETGKNLVVSLLLPGYAGLEVVGFLDDDIATGTVVFGQKSVLGKISEMEECVGQYDVEEVIICLDHADYGHLIRVLEAATRTRATVKISSPLYDIIPSRIFIEQYGDIPVVSVTQAGPSPLKEKYKRVFDIVLVSLGLILFLPFLVVIAIAIKFDSPGPVLFRQIRIGRNGVPFNFFKFRSMQVGSDLDKVRERHAAEFIRRKESPAEGDNGSTKIVNEARITRVGQWLRRLSLDEVPQFLNVLRGEMSLVGPRPCLPYEWEHYEEWHKHRLSVLPGCTGMWQVSGRSAVGFQDMVVLDLYYIQNASLWLDFRLLLKTVPVILLGTGAK